MTNHVNSITIVGKVIKHWTYSNNILLRMQIHRPAFHPQRTDGYFSDLVTAVLPNAVVLGQQVKEGQEIYIQGLIHSDERETSIASVIKDVDPKIGEMKFKQIITEVMATNWQIVK